MAGSARPPLGFVILSHSNPEQVVRLIETLNKLYGSPPIACHHDFFQSKMDRKTLPRNVKLVTPCIATGWGKFSVVEAFLAAVDVLYKESDPNWFCLLSGADYPIAKAEVVLDELEHSSCDAFLDVHQLHDSPSPARVIGSLNRALKSG